MTMHIVRGLSSLNTRKRKATVTKKAQAALAEYNQYRASIGLKPLDSFVAPRGSVPAFKPLKTDTAPRRAGSLAYQALKSCADTELVAPVRSVMDPRTLAAERPEVREAILAKSQRIAPAFSKGAYQYVTDGTDASDLGRKK